MFIRGEDAPGPQWINLDKAYAVEVNPTGPTTFEVRVKYVDNTTTPKVTVVGVLTTEPDAIDAAEKLLATLGLVQL